MTKRKPARPERTTQRLWDLLEPDEQRLIGNLMGNLIAAEPVARQAQLECLSDIERIMRLPPGRLAQYPEELIVLTETEEPE